MNICRSGSRKLRKEEHRPFVHPRNAGQKKYEFQNVQCNGCGEGRCIKCVERRGDSHRRRTQGPSPRIYAKRKTRKDRHSDPKEKGHFFIAYQTPRAGMTFKVSNDLGFYFLYAPCITRT